MSFVVSIVVWTAGEPISFAEVHTRWQKCFRYERGLNTAKERSAIFSQQVNFMYIEPLDECIRSPLSFLLTLVSCYGAVLIPSSARSQTVSAFCQELVKSTLQVGRSKIFTIPSRDRFEVIHTPFRDRHEVVTVSRSSTHLSKAVPRSSLFQDRLHTGACPSGPCHQGKYHHHAESMQDFCS